MATSGGCERATDEILDNFWSGCAEGDLLLEHPHVGDFEGWPSLELALAIEPLQAVEGLAENFLSAREVFLIPLQPSQVVVCVDKPDLGLPVLGIGFDQFLVQEHRFD